MLIYLMFLGGVGVQGKAEFISVEMLKIASMKFLDS